MIHDIWKFKIEKVLISSFILLKCFEQGPRTVETEVKKVQVYQLYVP